MLSKLRRGVANVCCKALCKALVSMAWQWLPEEAAALCADVKLCGNHELLGMTSVPEAWLKPLDHPSLLRPLQQGCLSDPIRCEKSERVTMFAASAAVQPLALHCSCYSHCLYHLFHPGCHSEEICC